MSRIRSLHPTQWTDEQFVSCSPLARLLAIGLRNEADDRGIFEWKPLTLKMRLLAADNCDASELLAELMASGQITKYSVDGKDFGLIRNFTAFQRPKKPVYRFPVPPEFPTSTEPLPPNAELSPQMKEEGGTDDGDDAPEPERIAVTRKMLAIMGTDLEDPKWFGAMARVEMWIAQGWSAENLILPAVTKMMLNRGSQGPPNGIAYVEKAIQSYAAELSKPLPEIANVNGTRAKASGSRLAEQLAVLDRIGAGGLGPLEPFGDPTGGTIIDQPTPSH